MDEVEIRYAVERDSSSIVSIIRDGFTSDFLSTTIYGCSGVEEYIRAHIKSPARCSDTEYLVAVVSDDIIGCLEFWRGGSGLWGIYVAVVPSARLSGVGGKLLDFTLRANPNIGSAVMNLDVLADNLPALRWYNKRGYKPVGEKHLFRFRLAKSPTAPKAIVVGFPQAEAIQRQFGFSEFIVRTDIAQHTVGRLGTKYYRFACAAALEDVGLLSFLQQMDCERQQVLYATPGNAPVGLSVTPEHYATLIRMSATIEDLLGYVNSVR